MSPEQIAHVETLQRAFCRMVDNKYSQGVKEHGGNIWDLSETELLKEAIMENIDQFVYLMTLWQKYEVKSGL